MDTLQLSRGNPVRTQKIKGASMIRMFAVLLVFCFAFSIEDSVFAENPYSKVFSEYSGINDIRFKGFVIGNTQHAFTIFFWRLKTIRHDTNSPERLHPSEVGS